MHKLGMLSGLAAVSLAFGATAHAQEASGLYAGAAVGQASVEIDGGFDGSDTAFKIFGGYAFNQHFAVELAYFDGGAPDERFGSSAVEVELTGFNASLLGQLPLSDVFTLFGKIGMASYDAEVSATVGGSQVASAEGSDEDLSYGIGGEFRFGPTFGLRAEYEMVDASDAEFNLLSVSAVFHF